ncbi:hypothetical protein F4808DRAFT_465457 [Astrocystis sublimbata]|nr:hypothetical protein F4808DRAFT_465457 [Astrocystis sublimbata]
MSLPAVFLLAFLSGVSSALDTPLHSINDAPTLPATRFITAEDLADEIWSKWYVQLPVYFTIISLGVLVISMITYAVRFAIDRYYRKRQEPDVEAGRGEGTNAVEMQNRRVRQ